MMAGYVFKIRVGTTLIPADEGPDLPDLGAVKVEALRYS
jgi:hypothetical protein